MNDQSASPPRTPVSQLSSTSGNRPLQKKLLLVILILSIGTIVDLILDSPPTIWSAHVLFELLLMLFGLGSAAYFWLHWRVADTELVASKVALLEQTAERDAWRSRAEKFLHGLGVEVDAQFEYWALTPAERDTALMILKGYEHKAIAAIQNKSERTVRQHARSIYRKSGLSSRAELAAFFLEDLLLPSSTSTPVATQSTA